MFSNLNKLFLVLLIWLIIIFSFIGYKEFILRFGYTVYLDIMPVDPTDIFRGDYMVFEYEINTLYRYTDSFEISESILLNTEDSIDKDVYLYFRLSDQSSIERPFFLSDRPNERPNYFIKGRLISFDDSEVRLRFGIENYYIPRGQGYKFNSIDWDELKAKVKIDGNGNPVLENLIYKGSDLNLDSINEK